MSQILDGQMIFYLALLAQSLTHTKEVPSEGQILSGWVGSKSKEPTEEVKVQKGWDSEALTSPMISG